jgi:hypothetical protein
MHSLLALATLGPLAGFVIVTLLLKGKPLHWLLDFVEWLFDRPVRALILFLAIVAVAGWIRAASIDSSRDAWRTAAEQERAAHGETKARVAAAAQGAADLAEFNRAAVEAKWQAQYQEAVHANDVLRDRNRALLAQWLHAPANRADQGGAGGSGLPGDPGLPAGPMQDAGTAIVPVADLVVTADAYAQLESLIGFVTAATTVATSPATPAHADAAR